MHEFSSSRFRLGLALVMARGGIALAGVAWLWPVNLTAMPPARLTATGGGAPSPAKSGDERLVREKLGPATLGLNAAKAVDNPGALELGMTLKAAQNRRPALVSWGEGNPFFDPADARGRSGSTPVPALFITAVGKVGFEVSVAGGAGRGRPRGAGWR